MSKNQAIAAGGEPEERRITIQIIRADGTVEKPQVVSYWHRNPLRRAYFKITGRVAGE